LCFLVLCTFFSFFVGFRLGFQRLWYDAFYRISLLYEISFIRIWLCLDQVTLFPFAFDFLFCFFCALLILVGSYFVDTCFNLLVFFFMFVFLCFKNVFEKILFLFYFFLYFKLIFFFVILKPFWCAGIKNNF
jgi:hypothetical protein